ncbi:MAG: hypothetical protein ACRD1X_13870 [Vicinamibacteria bacterium]
MRPFHTLAGFLLVVALSSAACDSSPNSDITAPTEVTFNLADLAEIIFARGYPIEVGDEGVIEFLPIPVRHFTVFGEDVLVLEFVGPNTAAAFASTISPDGTTVNGREVDWPATPHFFLSGQVIAIYLGNDLSTISALQEIMGPQFAGGEVDFGS